MQSILYNRVNTLSSNMLLFFHKSTITLLVMLSAIFPKWQDCVGVLITSNSWCPLLEYFQCTPTIAARTIQLQVILLKEKDCQYFIFSDVAFTPKMFYASHLLSVKILSLYGSYFSFLCENKQPYWSNYLPAYNCDSAQV